MAARRQGHLKEVSPGKWHIRVSIGVDAGGKRIRLDKTFQGSKAEAQRYLNAALRRKDDGFEVILTRQSLGVWIEEWLTTWCSGLSPRTKSDYDRLLRRYLPRELRVRELPLITATEIQRFVNDLVARGKSPRTVRMAHGALRTCLNRAVRLGKIARNVSSLVELPRNVRTERSYLGPEQAARFLSECASDKWGALFTVLILAGLRPGEALGLQWCDLDGNVLRVRRALVQVAGQAPILSTTKTGRSRVIPLGEPAMKVLREHRREQAAQRLLLGPAYDNKDLIFANEIGRFADSHNITTRHFKPLLSQLELPNLRLYDLRHTHATLLLAAGEHPKVVQERLGHSSIALTLDVYSHVIPAMQERATQLLDTLLEASKSASMTVREI
jgi:integrase